MIPSQQLLSEVLEKYLEGGKIDKYYLIKDERHLLRLILSDKTDCWNYDINIYELAHKCKEWAYTNHEAVINIFQKTRYNPYTAKLDGKVFQSDTEPDAIFKACEWIMEQKQND